MAITGGIENGRKVKKGQEVFKSNNGKMWQLNFYPEVSRETPYLIAPKAREVFVARFTQPCEVKEISVFNKEGFKIVPDFEYNKRYSLDDRMMICLEVENVSNEERIFDAVAFVEIFMKR